MRKVLVLFFILIVSTVYAREYQYIMRSPRALGMGNSYYTLSNDQYALFYNPAGLARIKDWRVDINVVGEAGTDSYNFYKDLNDLDYNNISDTREIIDFLEDYDGENQHISLGSFPAFYMKNFAIGAFAIMRGNGVTNYDPSLLNLPGYGDITGTEGANSTLDVEAYYDYGVTAGGAYSFFDDSLQIGAAIKYIHRKSLIGTYDVFDLRRDWSDIVDDDSEEGDGILGDVGVIYNIPILESANPRFGVAVNNIGTTSLGDAEGVKTTVNVSFAISPELGPVGTNFILEMHDVTYSYSKDNDYDNDFVKRTHAGAELLLFDGILAARVGLNQGYFTAGAGLDFNFVKVDYAFYSEEIGTEANDDNDDRHVLMVSVGF